MSFAWAFAPTHWTLDDCIGGRSGNTHPEQSAGQMNEACVFCTIAANEPGNSTMAWRQRAITIPYPGQADLGHRLVLPRSHFKAVGDIDDATTEAVILAVKQAAHAIDRDFPGDSACIWHSADQGSGCKIVHAHFHVHPTYSPRWETTHVAESDAAFPNASPAMNPIVLNAPDMNSIHPATKPSPDDDYRSSHAERSRSILWCGCRQRMSNWIGVDRGFHDATHSL